MFANHPPGRFYYQPSYLGWVVGFSIAMAKTSACASKRWRPQSGAKRSGD
jgi:hypothetical protein